MLEPLLKEIIDKITSKPEIENVEKEKQEYKLIGKFLRTKGLRLFSYNSLINELKELNIERGDTLHLLPEDGRLKPTVMDFEKVIVDNRCIHFEALNIKNARKRLDKYKSGKIKELSNLRIPGDGISFFN